MALLKAARVSDVPTLDVLVPDLAAAARIGAGAKQQRAAGRLAVIGHRGKGMNALSSPDRRLQEVKENSVRSFNEAARFAIDYVEFDVQVKTDSFLGARIYLVSSSSGS
jgi:glycerophosphoryl diester phosphodiesterase